MTHEERVRRIRREVMSASIQRTCERIAGLEMLVLDMYGCVEALCSCVENSPGCSMCPTNQDEDKACGSAEAYCLMRELGLEV